MSHAHNCTGSSCIFDRCQCWCHTGGRGTPRVMSPDSAIVPLVIPLSNDGQTVREARMVLPRPLSEAEWKQLHNVLRKMKPALVTPTEA